MKIHNFDIKKSWSSTVPKFQNYETTVLNFQKLWNYNSKILPLWNIVLSKFWNYTIPNFQTDEFPLLKSSNFTTSTLRKFVAKFSQRISLFQNVLFFQKSRNSNIKFSKLHYFNTTRLQNHRISIFQNFAISKLQYSKNFKFYNSKTPKISILIYFFLYF